MQRGDLESGEGLEAAGGGSGSVKAGASKGALSSKEGGGKEGEGARFFDDDDVLLEELRTEGERAAHKDSAGERAGVRGGSGAAMACMHSCGAGKRMCRLHAKLQAS